MHGDDDLAVSSHLIFILPSLNGIRRLPLSMILRQFTMRHQSQACLVLKRPLFLSKCILFPHVEREGECRVSRSDCEMICFAFPTS